MWETLKQLIMPLVIAGVVIGWNGGGEDIITWIIASLIWAPLFTLAWLSWRKGVAERAKWKAEFVDGIKEETGSYIEAGAAAGAADKQNSIPANLAGSFMFFSWLPYWGVVQEEVEGGIWVMLFLYVITSIVVAFILSMFD